MNRSIFLKFVAFLLAACALVAVVGSLVGVAILGNLGLYDVSMGVWQRRRLEERGQVLSQSVAGYYASKTLGGCPEAVLEQIYGFGEPQGWSAVLYENGQELWRLGGELSGGKAMDFTPEGIYYALPEQRNMTENTITVNVWEDGVWKEYELVQRTLPEYTVRVSIDPSYVGYTYFPALETLYRWRYGMIAMSVAGLLTLAACVVYLCWVAGRRPGSDDIRPGGLNRLPLDLYAVAVGLILAGGCWVGLEMASWTFRDGINNAGFFLCALIAVALSLILLGFCYGVVAQFKARRGFWWHNSLVGRILRGLSRFFQLLPVMWQWLLTAAVLAFGTFVTWLLAWNRGGIYMLALVAMAVITAAVVCYGGWCFGVLLSGVRRMNRGHLEHQISTKYLFGPFRDHAEGLNALSGCAVEAARKQLRSERMKTELITNVSHDIKTPLTSIINYVDLLQKPHSGEQEEQYLEVLARQSQALKKLIDDLMELSKASTGNLSVELGPVDAVEAVNQALGEYAEKFGTAGLFPVFDPPESALMQADGRLVWRVLSNLLGNAVKYALPGTRVYLDVARLEDRVMISVKNISRERLSVGAEELMERFVRGDASRNTEGSGLGLNIAKSLTELQKGEFRLMVDGDLFKVMLFFPIYG